jgi:hypothetical protein
MGSESKTRRMGVFLTLESSVRFARLQRYSRVTVAFTRVESVNPMTGENMRSRTRPAANRGK